MGSKCVGYVVGFRAEFYGIRDKICCIMFFMALGVVL
jgi:hypothetical protein